MKHIKLFESFKETNLNLDQVWYTGSGQERSSFTLDHLNKGNNNEHGPGIYLTNMLEDAKKYGKFIHVIKLNPTGEIIKRGEPVKKSDLSLVKNMIKKHVSDWEMEANNYHENAARGLDEFVTIVSNSAEDRIDFFEYVWAEFFMYEPKNFAVAMTASGIDGIVLAGYNKMEGIAHVVAYNVDMLEIQEVIKL